MADLTDVIIDGDPYDAENDSSSTVFLGATASTDGEQGDVPKPLAGEQGALLQGNAKWNKTPMGLHVVNGQLYCKYRVVTGA